MEKIGDFIIEIKGNMLISRKLHLFSFGLRLLSKASRNTLFIKEKNGWGGWVNLGERGKFSHPGPQFFYRYLQGAIFLPIFSDMKQIF